MVSRRQVLASGGAGVGLIVAWSLWPRRYADTLVAGPGEHTFSAWLKIGTDGRITVAVPQAEGGQGSWTALAQIAADELGADWRTVGVEPAPLNSLYGNPVGLEAVLEGMPVGLPAAWRDGGAQPAPTLTGGSSSVRMFEGPLRDVAATARARLCKAAAARWDAEWTACTAEAGFVVHAGKRLRFAELAAEAAALEHDGPPPIGVGGAGKLMGQNVPRLDAPAKVDGSANFAGDIRLPDMIHVAVRQGPIGDTRLLSVNRAAADRVRGVVAVVETDHWVGAAASTWWAASQALDALEPRFETQGHVVDDLSIGRALDDALAAGGQRVAEAGDLAEVFRGATIFAATYRVDAGLHVAIETPAAVARMSNDTLELWVATEAPILTRAAAAKAAGLGAEAVILHPLPIGGNFGQTLDNRVAEQAAVLAIKLRRPVSVMWSRGEALLQDRYRAPAIAKLSARIGAGGAIGGWQARIATPATGVDLVRQLRPGRAAQAALGIDPTDAYAVAGAVPPYRIGAYAVDHHPANTRLPTGHLRGGIHALTCFFTESFIDELAHAAQAEPLSYRIGMLGGEPRLARCLSTAASLGGWEGGVPGSGQGIACHAFRGSYVAVMAEARLEGGRPIVDRLVAAVDCGRLVNPDLVRQQVEGGLIFGLAHAIGASTGFSRNLAETRGFDRVGLPRLADTPDITVELIRSDDAPGGVSELAIPPVAPAIGNALWAATGYRIRNLPLRSGA